MNTIITKNLILRKFEESDYDDLHEFLLQQNNDELEEYPAVTSENCRQYLDERINSDDYYAVVSRKSGKVIGNIYYSKRDFNSYEIGCIINSNYRRKGYGREALKSMILYASNMTVHRVYATVDSVNKSSWKLLESAGLKREGHLIKNIWFHKDEQGSPIWKDTYIYAIITD